MAKPKDSQVTEKQIEKTVEDYLLNALPLKQKAIRVLQSEENVKRCLFGQENFLIISKYKLHLLPLNLLRRLPIYLLRQFAVQVEFDSYWYWALTHDVVKHCSSTSIRTWQLINSFETMMAAHFATLHVSSPMVSVQRLNRGIMELVSEPVKELVLNTDNILMYVCYPVLESLSKFVLSPLIDCDGKPLANFSDGNKNFKKGGRKISSLALILRSLEKNCTKILSKPDFAINLRDFKLEVEKMPLFKPKKNQDGWNAVYDLRNASLHGVKGWQLRSGLLTNLICLILWNFLDDQTLTTELESIKRRPPFYSQTFGGYYPPEM